MACVEEETLLGIIECSTDQYDDSCLIVDTVLGYSLISLHSLGWWTCRS
jgi:hypothetical protein